MFHFEDVLLQPVFGGFQVHSRVDDPVSGAEQFHIRGLIRHYSILLSIPLLVFLALETVEEFQGTYSESSIQIVRVKVRQLTININTKKRWYVITNVLF